MQCILCGKELEPVMETLEDGEVCLQPYDGTIWESSGNYGSRVFDSIQGEESLVIHICDDCLKAHADKMHAFKDSVQVPVASILELE
jgi:hypothetical protein